MIEKKATIYRPGPTDTLPALTLAFTELVGKYNELVRAFNEVVAKLEASGNL